MKRYFYVLYIIIFFHTLDDTKCYVPIIPFPPYFATYRIMFPGKNKKTIITANCDMVLG